MKLFIYLKCSIVFQLITSCSQASQLTDTKKHVDDELLQFAEASCFFWYFKKKNYDLNDIRAISGGIVEMGSHSADKYQKLSLIVKEYRPAITTKQNIDIDLLKCFKLDTDEAFLDKLNSLNINSNNQLQRTFNVLRFSR